MTQNGTNMRENKTVRLVERAQTGERAAFDQLLEISWEGAMRYTVSLVGADAAPDAVQSAFVEAWRDLPTLRNPVAFPAWLRRILFKHSDRLRRSAPSRSLPIQDEADPAPTPADILDASDEATRRYILVRRALHSLPPGERAAAILFYLGGCSHRDIAAYLGIRIPAVKSRLHSARGRLRERIEQMLAEAGAENMRPDETVAGLTEAERAEVLHGIRECYDRYEDAYEIQDPDRALPLMTDDYQLIFPVERNQPVRDKAWVEQDIRKCGPLPRGELRLKLLIDELLSVEREPSTRSIVQATVRLSLVYERYKHNHPPFGRIDTLKREGGTWRLRRTLGLGPEGS